MQKVIGLDIGSYSVKAVEIINTFKSYEITNFYENVIPHLDEVPLDVIVPNCMEQLFRENHLTADRIFTAMPGQFISSRVLPFNFSDPSKIEKAVFVEVEEAVPFNLDDMILDHQILGTMNGKTFALAVLTRKVFLRNFLDLLQRIRIDPKLVDVDSLAFYNLSSYMKVEPDESFAMVDCGHEKTSLCIVRNGVLRMFRSINLGGRYVTEFLSRDLELSFQEAQREKHRVSQLLCSTDQGADLSAEDRHIADRITLACNSIVKELGRTFYAFKTWEKTPIKKMFVSGGTSQIKNFTRYMEDELGLQCSPVRLEQTTLKISPQLNNCMSILPQSVAIGIRTVASSRRNSQINLRRGEFAYVQNYQSIFKYGALGGRLLALAVAMLMVSYLAKHMFYSSQIAEVREQYRKELTEAVPSLRKKYPNATANFAMMKRDAERSLQGEINQKKKAIEFIARQNSGSGPLLVLKALSEAISSDVKVDITSYDYKTTDGGIGKINIRGETDNYDAHSKILQSIQEISLLSEVKDNGTNFKPGSNQEVLQFKISATFEINSNIAAR